MRRKHRTKFSWFPIIGEESDVVPDGDFFGPLGGGLSITAADPLPMAIVALTWDYPPEVEIDIADAIPSLADFQGSEYQLERLVGKCLVDFGVFNQGGAALQTRQDCLVAAGFIILRVDEATGAPLRTGDLQEYNPFIAHNATDPWMWRRVWALGQQGAFANPTGGLDYVQAGFPRSNVDYGDSESGPHIDIRSVRRVRKEERVFFLISATRVLGGAPIVPNEGDDTGNVIWYLDYRILGRLLKASGRGNTSR